MKKKDYQKPTMDVVKLRHWTHLLQTSVQNSVQNYNWQSEDEE